VFCAMPDALVIDVGELRIPPPSATAHPMVTPGTGCAARFVTSTRSGEPSTAPTSPDCPSPDIAETTSAAVESTIPGSESRIGSESAGRSVPVGLRTMFTTGDGVSGPISTIAGPPRYTVSPAGVIHDSTTEKSSPASGRSCASGIDNWSAVGVPSSASANVVSSAVAPSALRNTMRA
jgi:hypothetical protein